MFLKCLAFWVSFVLTTTVNAEGLNVYTDNWAPYNYVNNDQVVGISTELVEATLMKANIPYKLVMMPWKRAYRETEFQKNSLLFTVNRTPDREKLFKWVGPLLESEVYLYRLKSREDIEISEFGDVKGYRVGLLRGGAVQGYFDTHGFDGQDYYLASKADLLLKMLFADRVDLIPGDRIDLAHQLNQAGQNYNEVERALFLYGGSYYIALNKDTPDHIVEALQTALDEVISEGTREKLISKYLNLTE